MSDVSKIKIGSTSYDIADKTARDDISKLNSALVKKYDESNVATGIGTLTKSSTSGASVKSATYYYQRVGRFVTLNISITLNSSTGSLSLSGLPFIAIESSNGICLSDEGVLCEWYIMPGYTSSNKGTLHIDKIGTGAWTHSSDEGIYFIATCQVS